MARPKLNRRSEGPVWRETQKSWSGRVRDADQPWSRWTSLGTSNRELAKELLARWVETGEPPVNERSKETFAVAAERIVDTHEKAGAITADLAKDRRTRLRAYALPSMGHVQVGDIKPHHVVSVLGAMATTHEKSAGYILKMRSDISQVLVHLVGEGAIDVNVAKEVPVPKHATVDTRQRVALSPEQVKQFQDVRGFDSELDMMALFSREIGGHRTSDEHAGVWEDVDLENFAHMKVRRPKTDGESGQVARVGKRKTRAYEYVTHEISAEHAPHIRAWWKKQGSPTSGPIFPLQRGGVAAPMRMKDGRVVQRKASLAGGHKGRGSSYAEPLRDAVWEAGIYLPFTSSQLKGRTPFDPARPDPSKCQLQTDTETTRRLTFQSFRGGLATALVDAGVTTPDLLAIMGWTQLSTPMKHYIGKRTVKVPDAARPSRKRGDVLKDGTWIRTPEEERNEPEPPALPPGITPELVEALRAALGVNNPAAQDRIPSRGTEPALATSRTPHKSRKKSVSPSGIEPLTSALGRHRGASNEAQSPIISKPVVASKRGSKPVKTQSVGQLPDRFAGLRAEAAAAVHAGDWDLADRIRRLIEPTPAPGVVSLDEARLKRRK